ncbi:MAG: MFS transporter [archaeon]
MVKKGSVVGVEHPIVQKKINESLELSVREGSMASVSSSFGLSYLSPFALLLNATAAQMGILYAIIGLLPSIVQLKASEFIRRFSRKKIVLWGVMIQVLLWIPIILTGVLFYMGVPHMIWVLITLVGLFYAFSAVNQPAWFSWMGSLVPEEKRGKYFAQRNRMAGFSGVVAMIIGAIILDTTKSIGIANGNILGYTLLGFGILFVFAASIRFRSLTLLTKQYEPRLKVRKKDGFSFWQFLKMAPSTPFGRFTLFRGILSIGVGISGPFWAVYMLRDLGFSYMWFMGITVSQIMFQLVFLPLLGKFSDRFGNVKLMRVCSWLIVMMPLLWMGSVFISSDLGVKIYLLLAPSMVGGFAWAGYNLATNNYVYDAVRQRKRGFGVAYMNLIVGVGTFIGACIGSMVAWIGISFMNTILFIFLISGIWRFFVAVFGVRYLKEVRHVKKFSSHYLIKEFRPAQGIVHEVHYLEHIVKKVEHYI